MKAIVHSRYGPPDVLRLEEVSKPIPGDNDVLIRIHATTVTAGDCELRGFRFPPEFWLPFRILFGLRGPRNSILGQELAGEIEAVGKDVTRFKEGDQVFAATTIRFGAYAEYICLPGASAIARKPTNMTFEEAAAVPTGGINALHFLRKARVRRGESVLINGAGGSIGTFAVQLAKHSGAEVTAVDHAEKLDMLRSLGADHVIDYTREDFTRYGKTYDVILDVVGTSPFSRTVGSLNQHGRYLMGNLRLVSLARGWVTSRTSSKTVIAALAGPTAKDLGFLGELIEDGSIKPVIDRSYRLEQIADAHRYVETGHKKGSVVINVHHSGD